MPKFTCIETISFNHEDYAPGETIELTAKEAAPLLAVGAVAEPVADKPAEVKKK